MAYHQPFQPEFESADLRFTTKMEILSFQQRPLMADASWSGYHMQCMLQVCLMSMCRLTNVLCSLLLPWPLFDMYENPPSTHALIMENRYYYIIMNYHVVTMFLSEGSRYNRIWSNLKLRKGPGFVNPSCQTFNPDKPECAQPPQKS